MKSKPFAFLLPRLQDIFFLTVFVTVLALGSRMLNLDGDLPRHLLTGRFILETRTIPHVEPFAYPYEGRPYVSHEWLADVIFYLIQNAFGLAGLVLLSALLLAVTFTALYAWASARFDARLPVLFLILWGAGVTSLNWVVRPHLISMCLLALWMIWLDKAARGETFPLWIFFVTMTLWSNLHGEFIAGMLATLAYTAGWTMEFLFNRSATDPKAGARLWGIFLGSGAASLLNPAAYHPYVTLIGFVGNPYLMSRMSESNPPDFARPAFLVLLGLLTASLLLLAMHPKRLDAGRALLLAGFSAMTLTAARNVHLYGVAAPFALAETVCGLTRLEVVRSVESALRNVEGQIKSAVRPVVIFVVFSAVILGAKARNLYFFDPTFFPVNAVTWLEQNPPQGRMFNDLNWGGYIAWRLWPEQKVFADSMADVTGEMTLNYETAVTMEKGWENIFSKYQITWAVLPANSALARSLETELGWAILYSDSTAVVLARP